MTIKEANFKDVVIGDGKTLRVNGVEIDADYGGTLLTPGRTAWCTIKRNPFDDDPGLAQITSDDVPAVIVDADTLEFPITPDVAELFPAARLYYDVMLDLGDGRSIPVAFGRIECEQQATRTR